MTPGPPRLFRLVFGSDDGRIAVARALAPGRLRKVVAHGAREEERGDAEGGARLDDAPSPERASKRFQSSEPSAARAVKYDTTESSCAALWAYSLSSRSSTEAPSERRLSRRQRKERARSTCSGGWKEKE